MQGGGNEPILVRPSAYRASSTATSWRRVLELAQNATTAGAAFSRDTPRQATRRFNRVRRRANNPSLSFLPEREVSGAGRYVSLLVRKRNHAFAKAP